MAPIQKFVTYSFKTANGTYRVGETNIHDAMDAFALMYPKAGKVISYSVKQ